MRLLFGIIDCGTTNTRVYILNNRNQKIGQGERRVGVRNTSMTGSKDALRQGVCEAVAEAAKNAGIEVRDLSFVIASGMITSEIGLKEIPHLVAPVGLRELTEGVEAVAAGEVIPIDVPVLFVRGVRNDYGEAILKNIRNVDFMRGEETQVIGILEEFNVKEPLNIIVLSSHTKLIHVDANGRIAASLTSLSGQLYEAICKESMIGKSLAENHSEKSGGYSFNEIVDTAAEVVGEVGLDRGIMIPRFLQVLLQTDSNERNLFMDAAVAADDMGLVQEFEHQGYHADRYILFGHEARCNVYSYLLNKQFGEKIDVTCVSDKERQSELTIRGAVTIANSYMKLQKEKK